MKHADIAMYQAKQEGRNTYRSFDADLASQSIRRLMIERALRTAIIEDEFDFLVQPQFDLETGAVVGAEALARWRHPTEGILPPDMFIPIAAEAQMLSMIGRRVISTVFRAAKDWPVRRDRRFRLALNVSVEELEHEDFGMWLIDAMEIYGIDPAMIELEVTENAAIFDSARIEAQVTMLQAAGISFAVDDFGIGYSNLARLKKLAFETLKIDRSLMQGVGEDEGATALIESIINMATALDLDVLAEGVETVGQLDVLRRLGCEYAQGFLLSRPIDKDAFAKLLEAEMAEPHPTRWVARSGLKPSGGA